MIDTNYQAGYLNALLARAEHRHRVLSENIANLNTPGYQTRDVSFDEILAKVKKNEPLDSGAGKPTIVSGLESRQDGNNVNVELELSKLTKNSLNYETYSQILASKLSVLRSAITGQ